MIRIRDSGNKGALVAVAAPKDTDTKVSVYLMAIEDVTEVSFLIFPQERPEALASISVDVKLSAGQNAKPPPRGPSPANPTVPDTPTLPNRPNQTTQPQPRNTP
ncbi:MAG: hypothetical protein J0M04_09140 [Verrucomicrobia bacterium]|nr:hypothetical protein [Verrucomicrobiota bacterium]